MTGVITLMPRNLMHGKRKMLFGKSSMRKLNVKAKLLIKYEQCLAMYPSRLIPPGIMDACGFKKKNMIVILHCIQPIT